MVSRSQQIRALKPTREKEATKLRAEQRRVAAKDARRGATNASRAFMDSFVRIPGVALPQEQVTNESSAAAVLSHEEDASESLAAPLNVSDDQHGDP